MKYQKERPRTYFVTWYCPQKSRFLSIHPCLLSASLLLATPKATEEEPFIVVCMTLAYDEFYTHLC